MYKNNWFSPGHRSWNCDGAIFGFTAFQAIVLEVLYSAWLARHSADVSQSQVLWDLGLKSTQFKSLFKKNGKMHAAWGTLIIPGATKGTYRLNVPPPPDGSAKCSFAIPPVKPRPEPPRALLK